ncbi:hypothetical protein NDU88_000544 [Pleurodeles waltl]|uniref:Uncharacterized protein n=1 Tax=Pleurodeles waltl TaxID=8319 RepID=A0AAV7TGM5_PLEWA|nr:hypothetical protein NDU88_000544 [Pleurodeles waltl]
MQLFNLRCGSRSIDERTPIHQARISKKYETDLEAAISETLVDHYCADLGMCCPRNDSEFANGFSVFLNARVTC